jgi:bifunctional DNA primase/polymerase-like protein
MSVEPLRDWALFYAQELGWETFPADRRTKRPIVSQHYASDDPMLVHEYWRQHPGSLIGHRLREEDLILDVDPRHGGLDTWRLLLGEMGGWPEGRVHFSGRGDGGVHQWFRHPGCPLSTSGLDGWARERGTGHAVVNPQTGEPYVGGDGEVRWSSGIDLLHRNWRYTILPPSPHPATGASYAWARGMDWTTPPGELPSLLLDLLTWTPPPREPWVPRARDEDFESVADEFGETTSWREILEPHGWDLVSGNGDEDGSAWRHPLATSAQSATVTHGCLFVYSPNTPFEVTMPGFPRGYTRLRAYATLEHDGDLSAASRWLWREWHGLDPEDDEFEVPAEIEDLLEQMLQNRKLARP